jgi:undecaprenyl-diphosphatase
VTTVITIETISPATSTGDVPGGPLGSAGFRDVNDFARDTSWLHGALADYATYGVVLFGLLLVIGYLCARSTGSLPRVANALWAAGGMGVALALNQLVAHAANETRPFVALPHVLTLVHHSADAGFPSDHAVMAGAVAAGLFLVSRLLGWLTTAAALLIAFARVYVGVHYPQDVLAGLALGAVVVLLTGLVARPLLVALLSVLARTPLRTMVTAD